MSYELDVAIEVWGAQREEADRDPGGDGERSTVAEGDDLGQELDGQARWESQG